MFQIRKMDLLIAVYIFCIAIAELMGAKTVPLFKVFGFQLNASVAIFAFPLLFTINDVITEVYGRERTRSVIYSGLIVVFLILLSSLLFTSLPPSSRFAQSEAHYDAVFGLSARISAASLIAFTVAVLLDVFVFSALRKKLGKKALWFRNNASNFVAQLADTTLFMTLAFYALDRSVSDNVVFLVGLILPYWLLKCTVSVLGTPLVYAGVKWLKSGKNE